MLRSLSSHQELPLLCKHLSCDLDKPLRGILARLLFLLEPLANATQHPSIKPVEHMRFPAKLAHVGLLQRIILGEFVDGSNPRGLVGFWVESGQTLMKFTDIKLERR